MTRHRISLRALILSALMMSAPSVQAQSTEPPLSSLPPINLGAILDKPANTTPLKIEPLTTPALQSRLASRTLLHAVTQAGSRLVAVGVRGHAVYSDDEGAKWQQAKVPVSSDLTCLYMVDARKGFAGGHDGVVLKTSDGGQSWQKVLDGIQGAQIILQAAQESGDPTLIQEAERYREEGATRPILGIWFADADRGWAVGAFGAVYATHDGGQTWQSEMARIDNPKFFHLNAIDGDGNEVFIVGEAGQMWRLVDDRWVMIKTPYSGSFFDVSVRAGVVMAVGMRANVWRSSDHGAQWQKITLAERSAISAITPIGEKGYVLNTQAGRAFISMDGGVSFAPLPNIRPMLFSGVGTVGPNKIALVGMAGVRVESLSK